MRIICRFRSSCACAKYHFYLCLPFIHSVISNDFVGGHWRPWSMQTDLGLCCLHMPRDVFMWHGPYDSTPIKVIQMLDWSITAVDYLLHTPTYMHWGKSASQQTNCDHNGDWFSFPMQEVLWLKQKSLGLVVLSIVSLACLLVVKMLAVFIAPACSRVRYRRPIFCPSVRLSTFMSTFDIYVKVSILINYKTKQPSNLAWNISLTSWLCNIGVRFSVCLSIRPSVCQHLCQSSTFMSKLVF